MIAASFVDLHNLVAESCPEDDLTVDLDHHLKDDRHSLQGVSHHTPSLFIRAISTRRESQKEGLKVNRYLQQQAVVENEAIDGLKISSSSLKDR